MLTIFESHFAKMKEELGIDENFGIEEPDPKLEEVKRLLKGNVKPQNFKKLLRKEQQVFKNTD